MSEDNVTIIEEFTLPSKGLVYDKPINPNFKLRSMTVAEEMKRLSLGLDQYRSMCEVIEACLIQKFEIPVYEMCLGDYLYLLHKLRIVTYGSDYNMVIGCHNPNCKNKINTYNFNLNELHVREFDESILNDFDITLPDSKKSVKLRLQTPKDLDWIEEQKREIKKKFPDLEIDQTLSLTMQTVIDTIDGKPLSKITGQDFLKRMTMKDANYLMRKSIELNNKIGIDTAISVNCKSCGKEINTSFRITNEFFEPEVY